MARSHLENIHLDVLRENEIVDFDVPPTAQVSVFAFLVPEPTKVPRQRVIFDTLLAESFADDAEQTSRCYIVVKDDLSPSVRL